MMLLRVIFPLTQQWWYLEGYFNKVNSHYSDKDNNDGEDSSYNNNIKNYKGSNIDAKNNNGKKTINNNNVNDDNKYTISTAINPTTTCAERAQK